MYVMNMQLRQCFARAKPVRMKKRQKKPVFVWHFDFQKSQRCSKGVQNFKFWLQKSQIGNPDQQFSVFIFADAYTGLPT